MANATCSVDECGTPAKTRGWCMKHYQQQYRGKATLAERVEPTDCQHCGESFRKGNGKIYCAARCREQAKHANSARVPCSTCGGPTGYKIGQVAAATCNPCRSATMTHGNSKGYKSGCRCGDCTAWNAASHAAYEARRKAGDYPMQPCAEAECESGAHSRGLCKMHYRRWARANGMAKSPSDGWTASRKAQWRKRQSLIRGASSAEAIDYTAVFIRDSYICQLCSEPVDEALNYPDPMSASLDHRVPVIDGGTHTYDNTQCSHLVCNMRKGRKREALMT